MKRQFPTRNEARAILKSLCEQFHVYNMNHNIPKKDIAANFVLWLNKKHNIEFVTFVITNACVDIFAEMNVDSENSIDTAVLLNKNKSTEEIESYFIKNIGEPLEDAISKDSETYAQYKIQFTLFPDENLDNLWFNNSDRLIHPLLNAYQQFKKSKGMLFQKDDIKQIPIDYSLILVYNHYKQKGYINNRICTEITKRLTNATNNAINFEPINQTDIEQTVLRDIGYPERIASSFDFIKQF